MGRPSARRNTMTKRIAALISTIGHPFLLLPVVLSLLTLRQGGLEGAWPTLLAIWGGLLLMTLYLVYRKRKGLISNWDVSVRSQRSKSIYQPILILIAVAAALLYYFKQPFVGQTLVFGLFLAVCFAINSRLKISQHTAIAAYLSLLLIPLKLWAGLILLAFTPFIAWSRVVLGRHLPMEVTAGGVVGAAFGALQWWLFG